MSKLTHRRGWLQGIGASGMGLWLAACTKLNDDPKVQQVLQSAEGLTRRAHRTLIDRMALAKEFTVADISNDFRANGSVSPVKDDYRALLQDGFADYALTIEGLVEYPQSLSLAQLRQAAARI